MRAFVADSGPDLVRLVEVAPPVPGAGEVLIDVVPTDRLAALPAGLSDDLAAALPVAAVTAQRVLQLAGELADRRVAGKAVLRMR